MYVCTLKRYYDRVYFCFRHLEFEPSGSAVAPNPTSFKNGVLGQKDHVSHWMDKIIYEDALTRTNTARKYWSPTKLFVIRKIFWMYLYRNCLQRLYKICSIFGIKQHQEKLSSLCQILAGNFLLRLHEKLLQYRFFSYFGYSQIMSYLCQKCKKIGGHRLRFQNKARGKLPQFWQIGPRNSIWPQCLLVEKYLKWFAVDPLS